MGIVRSDPLPYEDPIESREHHSIAELGRQRWSSCRFASKI